MCLSCTVGRNLCVVLPHSYRIVCPYLAVGRIIPRHIPSLQILDMQKVKPVIEFDIPTESRYVPARVRACVYDTNSSHEALTDGWV